MVQFTLTRRRDPDRQEAWLIYYGDVHVGTIAVRTGIPHDQPAWGWRCGFYPKQLMTRRLGSARSTKVHLISDTEVNLARPFR